MSPTVHTRPLASSVVTHLPQLVQHTALCFVVSSRSHIIWVMTCIIPANQKDLNVCEFDKGKLLDVDQILAELAGLFYT